jgi:hypothetical protein
MMSVVQLAPVSTPQSPMIISFRHFLPDLSFPSLSFHTSLPASSLLEAFFHPYTSMAVVVCVMVVVENDVMCRCRSLLVRLISRKQRDAYHFAELLIL